MLDIPEIEQRYTMYQLDPFLYYDKLINLANIWIMGVEDVYEKAINMWEDDFEEDQDCFLMFFLPSEGYDNHPEYGKRWDIRSFEQMKDLRNFLFQLKNYKGN